MERWVCLRKESLQNNLFCFTTSRGKRDFLNEYNNSLPPKVLTIGDFFKRVVLTPNKTIIDSDTRKLLLKEASNFSSFKDLNIPTDFFKFLENSNAILRFFDELSSEYVSLESIELVDTYAEYDYHLSILKTLLNNYKTLLEEKNLIDSSLMRDNFSINKGYVERFEKITIFFEGYPTEYEKRVYEEVSKLVDFEFDITLTPFDKKLRNLFDLELDVNYRYKINISKKLIVEKLQLKKLPTISLVTAQNRVSQIAYLKEQIKIMVDSGISVDKIAVITPDENYGETLLLFDTEENLNFAKGFLFSNSYFYKLLKSVENYKRESRESNLDRYKYLKKENSVIEYFFDNWDFGREKKEILEKIKELANFCSNDEKEIIFEELFKLEKILKHIDIALTSDITHLFLTRVSSRTLDHRDGGKITVVGLLETRESSYDGVIIVDFSDAFAPKDSNKDLFINTAIKKRAGLPSTEDRENYQKSLYFKIMEKAKMISIISTENDEERPSKFIKAMGLKTKEVKKDFQIALLKKDESRTHFDSELILDIDLTEKAVSSTKLKNYLTCKRRFYYKYIQPIKPHRLPQNSVAIETGNIIHGILQELFETKNSYGSFLEIKKECERLFDKHTHNSPIIKYQSAVWRERIDLFLKNEIKRFESGYSFGFGEKEFSKEYNGVFLTGVIDRVDLKDDLITILDYKTGKYETITKRTLEKTTDFQLIIYYLLLKETENIENLGIYDLGKGKIVYEDLLEEKLALLEKNIEIFKEKNQNFSKTETVSNCIFCDFKLICNR